MRNAFGFKVLSVCRPISKHESVSHVDDMLRGSRKRTKTSSSVYVVVSADGVYRSITNLPRLISQETDRESEEKVSEIKVFALLLKNNKKPFSDSHPSDEKEFW